MKAYPLIHIIVACLLSINVSVVNTGPVPAGNVIGDSFPLSTRFIQSSLHGNPEVGVGPDGEEPLNHYVAPSEEAEELALREEIRSQFTLMNTMTKDMIHAKRAGGTDLRSGLSAILREVTSLTARWGILEQRELPGNVRHTRDLIRPFFHAKLGELLGMCVELQARIEADKTTDPLSRMDLNQIIAKLRAVPDFKADERSEHVIVHM